MAHLLPRWARRSGTLTVLMWVAALLALALHGLALAGRLVDVAATLVADQLPRWER